VRSLKNTSAHAHARLRSLLMLFVNGDDLVRVFELCVAVTSSWRSSLLTRYHAWRTFGPELTPALSLRSHSHVPALSNAQKLWRCEPRDIHEQTTTRKSDLRGAQLTTSSTRNPVPQDGMYCLSSDWNSSKFATRKTDAFGSLSPSSSSPAPTSRVTRPSTAAEGRERPTTMLASV
jgi:hypothetical protein